MQIAIVIVAMGLPLLPIADSSAMTLDEPNNVEATAAYRAIPAVGHEGASSQQQTAEIKSCKAATGQPGVICETAVEKTASAPSQVVTIHFARGPDSAWIATLEQTAP